jgi:hypothetical protein
VKKGGFYKHVNCTDVAVECKRIIFIPEKKGYKVKVSWVNVVNPKKHYPCGITEEIFIPSSLIRDWLPLEIV